MNSPNDDGPNVVEDQSRKRQRRYWMGMAFLPGVLSPVGCWVWAGLVMDGTYGSRIAGNIGEVALWLVPLVYLVLSMAWIAKSSGKLAGLGREESQNSVPAGGCGLMIGLTVGNAILGTVLAFGACAMMG